MHEDWISDHKSPPEGVTRGKFGNEENVAKEYLRICQSVRVAYKFHRPEFLSYRLQDTRILLLNKAPVLLVQLGGDRTTEDTLR